ncbi:Oidioi.mRNA.OKI2018_I69.PAR.g10819.t1.cds [Oikopleura dioica]|uniref:Oidioi.mRNA.OKI2018_I69.PAR.g10819.t1.cds n=1 Tax=Oikopleura dioica TaxID=34765 RepID=A0ABN7RW65_OIKDI|nr:Oidioi.mRNA.OKI2018_I69.PAR.g10819.t1.cds [Oikopleura dioica]
MGACTSTAAGSSSAETCDNVYRIRQLDEKYRRKQLFILRLTDKQIIIMRKGRREKPEKTISLYPDSNSLYVLRYGIPELNQPAILLEVKGFRNEPDVQYLFYCKRHEKLFEQLQKKISEASKRISRGTLRYTPVSTPTPTTPGHNTSQPSSFHLNGSIHTHSTPQMVDPLALPHFQPGSLGTSSQPPPGDNNYVNTEQPVVPPQTPRNNSSFGGSRFNMPLSPVAEDEQPLNNMDQASGKFVLDQPPLTRAELQKRRMAPPKTSPPSTFEPNWPGMPPQMRFGSGSFFCGSGGNTDRDTVTSRTSLSTRSSGLLNQLSARSDCEPLLMPSNVSTPNPNHHMRFKQHNSSDPIYVQPNQPDEFTAPRTPGISSFTAPPQSCKRFIFPPMDALTRPEGSSMNYVTVEHNSMSSSNSTPRTPKTPSATVQYTPVDFQKTEELHRSQSITRVDSTRSRSALLPQKN